MDFPSSADQSRRLRLAAFLGALLLAGAIAPGTWASLPDLCPFHRLTGLPCPTCGLTRAWAAALRGDWALSFRLHAFGIPALLILAGLLGFELARNRWPRIPRPLWIAGGVLWVGYGVGRMLGLVPGP